MHLTDERLEAARISLQRLDEFVANLGHVTSTEPREAELDVEGWIGEMKEGFHQAMCNDLNISAALAALFSLVRKVNYLMHQHRLRRDDAAEVMDALRVVDEVLGILPPPEEPEDVPEEVHDLLRERETARREKDFAVADRIRDDLATRGYVVEDLPTATRLKRKT